MPTLKQLTTHVLHGHSTVPLKEYGTTYTDGTVTTYIAIPTNPAGLPVPFSIHLSSNGYIAPGLAMFVFIDGVYQCNRNREDLVWDLKREVERVRRGGDGDVKRGRRAREREEERKEREREKRARDVKFVVRQKEEKSQAGSWIGRPWRFEEFRVVNALPDVPDIDPETHFAELGDIVVLVLRCVSKRDKPDADSDSDSDAPRSAMAPGFDLDDSDSDPNSEEDTPTLNPSSKGKEKGSMQATVEDAPEDDAGLMGLFGVFDGDNTGYYGQQYTYHPYQSGEQQRNWEQQPWQMYNQQLQQWNGYTQQWEPVPTQQYTHVPLQYNPGYTSQPQYVSYSAPEKHSHPPVPVPAPIPFHNHSCPSCGNNGPHETSAQRRASSACKSCGNSNPQPRSLNQHLHANTQPQYHALPSQTYPAPQPAPPPPPPPPPRPAQPPQRHVHWADQQPQHPPAPPPRVQTINLPATHAQPQPQEQRDIAVPPIRFGPTYTYVPGQGYYHDHTAGGYVIEDGMKVYSECEVCQKAAEESRKKEKGGKKKKKGKGKGEKEKNDGNEKGKGGKKGGKKKKDKEKKEGDDNWGEGGGGDSWGNNDDQNNDTSGDNNGGSGGWGNDNNNSSNWDNNDNNGNNGDNQNNSDNWNSAPQPSPSLPRNTGDSFASGGGGGDPFAQSQNQSRSQSRNRNQRDASPTRSHHGHKSNSQANANLNPILVNHLEDGDEFVTPMYRDPVPDEPPLYTVPENIAKERSLTHQVQTGRSLPYFHKVRTPRYLDTLDEPYARFVFKYRRRDVIEDMFKVTVERDVDAERKVLEALPRDQIVETLLRTQGLLGTAPVKRLPSRSRPASRSVSWNLNSARNDTSHTHNQTRAASSHTRPHTTHTSPARNDTSSFAGALMDKLSAVDKQQGNWDSNDNRNSWDNNNATTPGDPFASGGGGGRSNTAYNSPCRPTSPEAENQW